MNKLSTSLTRQNLLDAFWEIYAVKRIEKITVKEITSRAGYNRSTFYEYFTDVYHLLDELEGELIPTIHELPAFSTDSGIIGIPLESFMELYDKNSKYYSVLLGPKGDPAFSSKLKTQIKSSLLSYFQTISNNTCELDYTLEYILSAMVGVMSYWFSNEQDISKEQLIALIKHLSESGIMHFPNS